MAQYSSQSSAEGDGIWEAIASAKTPEEFCRGWLAMQCRIVDGVSDAVVVLGSPDEGRFSPVATWPRGKAVGRQLGQCAERALSEKRSLVLKQEASDSGDDTRASYQVAYPIQVRQQVHGVVALDVGPRNEEQLNSIVGQLANGSAWLEGLLARSTPANGQTNGDSESGPGGGTATKNAPSAPPSSKERLQLKAVLDVVATAIGENRYQAGATALVTELATRLQCERVSLGVIRRKRAQLQALSHSAQFGKKTNLVRALEKAMDESLDQSATVLFPQSSLATGSDFRITKDHAELSKEYGSGSITSVPLNIDGEICAVITLERPADLPFDKNTIDFCETLGSIVGPLLELRRRDERTLAGKTVDSGRKLGAKLLGPGHLAWKLAGIIVLAAIVFFTFAHGNFRVTADTVLEGKIQRAAVAPFTGYIATAPVRAGDRVQEGDLLCSLDDRALRLEHVELRSQHEQLTRQYNQALALNNRARVTILSAQISQAKARLDQIEEQLERLQILAPFDGLVVQGDLSQSIGARVERGDVLFEIAPLGDYRVIQEVDERDVDELREGQQGALILSTYPNEKFAFTVTKITPVSTTEEGRNYFRVEAALDDERAESMLRPGMEGVSKIEIDRRRLIWIWTHRAVDWCRLTFWSWMP